MCVCVCLCMCVCVCLCVCLCVCACVLCSIHSKMKHDGQLIDHFVFSQHVHKQAHTILTHTPTVHHPKPSTTHASCTVMIVETAAEQAHTHTHACTRAHACTLACTHAHTIKYKNTPLSHALLRLLRGFLPWGSAHSPVLALGCT